MRAQWAPTFMHSSVRSERPILNNPYAPPAAPLETAEPSGYLAVSKRKLTIMLIGTWCLYAAYWSYRQWKAYAKSTGGSQWAWARGFIWWVFAYNLFGKLDTELRARGETLNWSHRARGLILLAMGIGSGLFSALGPIYSLWPSLLLLLVAVYTLRGTLPALNRLANDPKGDSNSRLTWANWIWLLVGGFFWGLAGIGAWLIKAFPERYIL